jgi:hypothetical protein
MSSTPSRSFQYCRIVLNARDMGQWLTATIRIAPIVLENKTFSVDL